MPSYATSRRRATLALLAALLLAVAAYSLTSGVISTSLGEVVAALPDALAVMLSLDRSAAPQASTPQLAMILAEIRIPRLLLGLMVGAGLAICGAIMQGLFRNPMADPGLLGVSSGAALGAVLTIVLGGALFGMLGDILGGTLGDPLGDPLGAPARWPIGAIDPWLLPAMAFAGGVASILVVHRLSVVNGKTDIATMLLAGIAVNAITGAGIGLLSYIADDAQLRDLIFWSLGSLEITDRRKLLVALVFIVPALLWLPRYAPALNANLLGEREAGHLGVEMEKIKRQLIVLVALVVGISVSLSGVIGFVGLVVPHLIRILTGPDHRLLLPASALFGATLLIGADIVARTAVAPAEIPIGIITAILGGPFFLWLLMRFHHARSVR